MTQISKTYEVFPPQRFRQDGILQWKCDLCGKKGRGSVKLVTKTEMLTSRDVALALSAAEAEHSITHCSGGVSLVKFDVYKIVELIEAPKKPRSTGRFILPVSLIAFAVFKVLYLLFH